MRYLLFGIPVALVIGNVGCSKSKCEDVCAEANRCSPCYTKVEQTAANEIPGCKDGTGSIVGRTVAYDCTPLCDDVEEFNATVKTWGADCATQWEAVLDCWQSKTDLICDPGDPDGEADPSGCFAKGVEYTDCVAAYCQVFDDAATARADAETALYDDCDATATTACEPRQASCDVAAMTECGGVPATDCEASAQSVCGPYCEVTCPPNPDDPEDPDVQACLDACFAPCVDPLVETCVDDCIVATSDTCMAECISPKMATCVAAGQADLPYVPVPDQHCSGGGPTLMPF